MGVPLLFPFLHSECILDFVALLMNSPNLLSLQLSLPGSIIAQNNSAPLKSSNVLCVRMLRAATLEKIKVPPLDGNPCLTLEALSFVCFKSKKNPYWSCICVTIS